MKTYTEDEFTAAVQEAVAPIQAHEGKQFKSQEEYKDAYNRWWSKYSSNPNNLKYVVQRAYDRYNATVS